MAPVDGSFHPDVLLKGSETLDIMGVGTHCLELVHDFFRDI